MARKQYCWKVKHPSGSEDRGTEENWSKMMVRDWLAQLYPRIPMNKIVVWPIAEPEPGYPQAKKKFPKPVEFGLHAREHRGQDWRVWRTDWVGDVFEILTAAEFEQLQKFVSRFSIPFKILGLDEDE